MLWQILKKDLVKRKGVNTILFLFITLATIFLASSINNIMVVSSAVEYYMDYAHVPDVSIVMNSKQDKENIDSWLENKMEKGAIKDYDSNYLIEIPAKSIKVKHDKVNEELQNQGTSLYMSTMSVDYCQVFDLDGKTIILNDQEIAVPLSLMKSAKLKVGDKLLIKNGDIEKEWIIKTAVKDAAFGNEMVGMSHFIINQNCFDEFENESDALQLYYIMTSDPTQISQEISNQGFTGIMNTITIDTYKMMYSFDMIMAGLLILIGVCLILIALLVLRFTIVFSLEEQYQEIGILKAIGLRDYAIKKIYLIKYLAIVVFGTILGTVLSVPVGEMMIKSVSENMIMASSQLNIIINIFCALLIIILVLSFCYFCTRKLNKVSAITAIRGGHVGERFNRLQRLSLEKMKYLPVPLYLGLNDILSHLKRYLVLIITFSLSFILITIPLNTLTTMNSNEMVRKFSLDPNSSVYVRKIEDKQNNKILYSTTLMERIDKIREEIKEKGYDVQMSALPIYFINYNGIESKQKNNIMTVQLLGKKDSFLQYDEGKEPFLENEIAFSKDIMKANDWIIGDYVQANINGQEKMMIITGTYSDYMQLGKSARLNAKISCDQEKMFDYWAVMVDMKTDKSQDEVVVQMQELFPDYEWITGQQLINQNVGGIQDILSLLLMPMTLMLCGVIMLITLLMEKLFITREKGEIAMMKSIGFTQSTICLWQIMRMIFVVMISMIIAIPLSLLSNQFLLKPIFAIMGAEVAIQVDLIKAYLIYPSVLLVGIIIATVIAANSIKSVNIREMNSME